MTVSQGLLPFHIQLTEDADPVTAYAGLPLVLEGLRAVIASARYRALRDGLGYQGWKVVRRHTESLVLLVVAGGEHISDLDTLRADAGLERLLGFRLSGTSAAKDFLYRFHQKPDGQPLTPEDDAQLSVKGTAQIRPEGPGLLVLETMVLDVVEALQFVRPRTRATLDVDATLVEAIKKTTLKAYEGTVGYQPQMAWWAEQGVWVADEFRDGNVPAHFEVTAFLQRAFGNLPATITSKRFRGDSALYDEKALTWVADEAGVEFAVTAKMSASLSKTIGELSEAAWQPYRSLNPAAEAREERQWAEVKDFVPAWKRNAQPGAVPFRYLAIRVRSLQPELFEEDEVSWRHFSVVTNMKWRGDRLLRWHREKQGTVEHGHGVLKSDLGGGVLPTGKFGSNAAWWRLQVLAANLLELLKVQALPEELSSSRPKRLRFCLFCLAGRLVTHARRLVLRVSSHFPLAAAYVAARGHLQRLALQLRVARAPG